jgi:DNA-binding Xre family transcriptional regulator
MPIIYTKLLKLLEDKGINSYVIKKEHIIGQASFTKIKTGGDIDTRTIAKLCNYLNCQPGDIMEYIPDEATEKNSESGADKTS